MNRRRLLALIGLAPFAPLAAKAVDATTGVAFTSEDMSAKTLNYWRSTAAELVSLAPREPFLGYSGFEPLEASEIEFYRGVRWTEEQIKALMPLVYKVK